jgi:hypothetical protein
LRFLNLIPSLEIKSCKTPRGHKKEQYTLPTSKAIIRIRTNPTASSKPNAVNFSIEGINWKNTTISVNAQLGAMAGIPEKASEKTTKIKSATTILKYFNLEIIIKQFLSC